MFWIGLYLDGSMVKWAKVSQNKKNFSIDLMRTFAFSDEKPFCFPQSGVEDCCYKLISGLPTSQVLLREIPIKQTDKRKIYKLLPFQVEPLLPWDQEDAILSTQIYPGAAPKSSTVAFYATKKSSLQKHIELFKNKEADPDETSCIPAGLWRFAQHFFPHLSDTLILNVGFSSSTLVGIKDKRPIFSHSFALGTLPFSEALKSEKEEGCFPNLLEACKETKPKLYELAKQTVKELDRVFTFVDQKHKTPWSHIILTGNFSTFPLLKNFISHHLPPAMQLHECENGDSYDAMTLEAYAIAVGLSLDAYAQDGRSTEFRKKVFTSSSEKKQRLRLLSSFALACLMLSSTTLLISNMYRNQVKNAAIEAFQQSFSYKNKHITSLDDLKFEVELKERALLKEKIPFQLSLPLPRVSDVLAWLSSHPVLSVNLPAESEGHVDMKKVKYQLLKHPKITTPTLPYQGKVELEMDIPSATTAKQFHEALKSDTSIIDTRKEISWENKGGLYLVSFFLKPFVDGGRP